MRFVLFTFLSIGFLFSQIVFGLSPSCTPVNVKIQNKNILLPGVNLTESPQIYFLHNISKKSLWIDHPMEGKPSAKAGWSSFFQPEKWSAILVNRKDFALNCAFIEPGKVNFQDCAKVLAVCSPKEVQYSSKRKGSYWLAEDKAYEELIAALNKRGVIFPTVVEKTTKTSQAESLKEKNDSDKNANKKAIKKEKQVNTLKEKKKSKPSKKYTLDD